MPTYPGFDRASANAALNALRSMGDVGPSVFCGPHQVHTRLGGNRFRARFGHGLTYRPDPINLPYSFVVADPTLSDTYDGADGTHLGTTKTDTQVKLPLAAGDTFVMTVRGWGSWTLRFPDADNSVKVQQLGPYEVLYANLFTDVDLHVVVGNGGWKMDFVVKGPGAPASFTVQETVPQSMDKDTVDDKQRDMRYGSARMLQRIPYWEAPDGSRRYMVRSAEKSNNYTLTFPDMSDVEYPYTFDPTSDFYPDADPESTTVDGWLEASDVSWSSVHDATSANKSVNDNSTTLTVGAYLSGGYYLIDRGYALFDTSSLSGATVSAATLTLDIYAGNYPVDIAVTQATGPASDTALAVGDYAVSNFGTVMDRHTLASAPGSYDLSITPAYVNTSGITRLGLRSGKDIDDSAPSGYARAIIHSADNGTSVPLLHVTYLFQVNKIVNESVSVSETTPRHGLALHIINETVSVTETVVKAAFATVKKVVNETVAITEAVVSAFGRLFVVNESVSVAEAVSHLYGFLKVVNETISVTESTPYLRSLVRIVNETVSVTESVYKATSRVVRRILASAVQGGTRVLSSAKILGSTRVLRSLFDVTRILK